MWLEAPEAVDDVAPGVSIARGERILMEVSRKFTVDKLRALAFQSGFFWQVAPLRPWCIRAAGQQLVTCMGY